MFVIQLKYIQPINVVDQYLLEHRAYLDDGYQKNYFIASGPQSPRTGGVILSQLKDRAQLETIIQKDPFYVHGIAEFNIIEFDPVKFHPQFGVFILSN